MTTITITFGWERIDYNYNYFQNWQHSLECDQIICSKFLGKRCDNFWPQNVMMMAKYSFNWCWCYQVLLIMGIFTS